MDERTGPNFVRGPVVTMLDSDMWRPDLPVPPALKIDRLPGELVVYHAVGNYELRRASGRDIKGTGATLAAVERLKLEGFPLKLIFATKVPSSEVRFLQVQADVIVDQLNYRAVWRECPRRSHAGPPRYLQNRPASGRRPRRLPASCRLAHYPCGREHDLSRPERFADRPGTALRGR